MVSSLDRAVQGEAEGEREAVMKRMLVRMTKSRLFVEDGEILFIPQGAVGVVTQLTEQDVEVRFDVLAMQGRHDENDVEGRVAEGYHAAVPPEDLTMIGLRTDEGL